MRLFRVSFASRSRLVRAVSTTVDARARFRGRRVANGAFLARRRVVIWSRHPFIIHRRGRRARDEGLLTVRDSLTHHTTVCDSPKSPSRACTTTARARRTVARDVVVDRATRPRRSIGRVTFRVRSRRVGARRGMKREGGRDDDDDGAPLRARAMNGNDDAAPRGDDVEDGGDSRTRTVMVTSTSREIGGESCLLYTSPSPRDPL